jgi:hypothetical protein
MIPSVNEGSTLVLGLEWIGYDGQPAAPASVRYRIDCETTGLAVRAATDLDPGASLTLGPSDTALLGDGGRPEDKVVTLAASWGGADQLTEEYRYRVLPLRGYPL